MPRDERSSVGGRMGKMTAGAKGDERLPVHESRRTAHEAGAAPPRPGGRISALCASECMHLLLP